MAKRTNLEVVETKKSLLTDVRYSKIARAYQVWNNQGFENDKQLFCNVYDKLLEALEIMKTIDNSLIWVGFNKVWAEDLEQLNRIVDRLF